MKIKFVIFILISCISMTACLPDTSGIAPPSDRLIYPIGAVTTASDKYLLVANSNFDLNYNAGTLVAISLEELDRIIDQGDWSEDWLSPDGRYMYVPETKLIDPNNTVRLDAFASDLKLTPKPKQNRALIPIRGGAERHILVVDIDETAPSGEVLTCGKGSDLHCDSAHRVTSNDSVTMPIEPYEVTSLDYTWTVPDSTGAETTFHSTLGFATHLYTGSVSMFMIENEQGKLDAQLLDVVNHVVNEASGIASNPENKEIYVSGRENAAQYLAVLQVLTGGSGSTSSNNLFFGVVDKVSYFNELLGGTDTRGVAVSSAGKDALVVSRTPEALLRIDTESRKLIDMATVGTDPSVVSIYESEDGNAYAFVLCFKSKQVFIVEPSMMRVVVRSTGSGPQAIAFDKHRKYAYIANFRESTITVLHAEPPFAQVRIGDTNDQFKNSQFKNAQLMIGKPRLPEDHNN